jgi:hypothetical protein
MSRFSQIAYLNLDAPAMEKWGAIDRVIGASSLLCSTSRCKARSTPRRARRPWVGPAMVVQGPEWSARRRGIRLLSAG